MNSDFVISLLRTGVPAVWGALITWLLANIGWLPSLLEQLNIDPTSEAVVSFVVAAFFFLWYAFWRWVQRKNLPWVPPLVIMLAMGSTAVPEYYNARHDGVDDPVVTDERGAFDNSLLITVAMIVVIICGVVWLLARF